MSKLSQQKNFDQLLIEAIDEGLSYLGEAGKASIYINLEGFFNIRKQEIPNKTDAFLSALKRIFGVGFPQLEILIQKKLQEKVRQTYNLDDPSRLIPDLTLKKYIELMRLYCKNTEKTGRTQVWVKQKDTEDNL